jgi:hypothetical protein
MFLASFFLGVVLLPQEPVSRAPAAAPSSVAPRFAVYEYGADLRLRDRLIAGGRMYDDLGGWIAGAPDARLAAAAGAPMTALEGVAAGDVLFVIVEHGAHGAGDADPFAAAGAEVWTSPDARIALRAAPKSALDGLPVFQCHGAGRIVNPAAPIAPRAAFRAPGGSLNALNPDPEIAGWVAQVTQPNLLADVNTMVAFGTRRHFQPGEVACENWLEARMASLGLAVTTWDYDSGADVVIGELPGVKDPTKIVVIGGHYDSIVSSGSSNGPAPGADDDASGVAAVLEIARILSQQSFDYTIRFCAWSGEEYGLLGSEAYAAHLDNINADVIGMVQLDMVAYRAPGDTYSVDFVLNDTDPGLNAFSMSCYEAYVPTLQVKSGSLSGGTSDHRSFFQHGFAATFPFEDLPSYSPYIHSTNDVVGVSANDFQLAEWITEGALATVAELARPASLTLAHVGLPDTQDEQGPYVVDADVTPLGGATTAGVELVWRVGGGNWNSVAMSPTGSPNEWRGLIPGQASPAMVDYHLIATASNGRDAWLPDGFAPGERNFRFVVGVFQSLYANAFDGATDEGWTHAQISTQDDWQRGTPMGNSGDPSAAYSPTRCWGNDLGPSGFNGAYQPNVHNYLRSPAIDCSGKTGVRLRLQRWLTVEEGIYDQAKIEVNGIVVWQNPPSGDLLDNAWTPMDLDVSQWADGNPAVQITFRLQSDGGVQYGGWNLDDFELYVLGAVGGGGNAIVLNGPVSIPAGAASTWTFSGAPASAPYWFLKGASANGLTYQGHVFDVGAPVSVLKSGTTSPAGGGSVTLNVPGGASGATAFFEVASKSGPVWKDSNLLTVTVQ